MLALWSTTFKNYANIIRKKKTIDFQANTLVINAIPYLQINKQSSYSLLNIKKHRSQIMGLKIFILHKKFYVQ